MAPPGKVKHSTSLRIMLPKAQHALAFALTKPAKGHARKCILGGLLFYAGQGK